MTQEELLIQILEELRYGAGGGGAGSRGNSSGNDSASGGGKSYENLIRNSREAADNINKLNGSLVISRRRQQEFSSEVARNSALLNQLEKALEEVQKSADAEVRAQESEIKARISQAKHIENVNDANRILGKGIIGLGQVTRSVGGALITGATSVLGAIQSGSSGISIAGSVIEMGLSGANSAAQAVAGGMTTAGIAIASSGNSFQRGLGIAITAAGALGGALSALGTQALSASNNLMMAQGEKLLNSYKAITSSGAILAGGADRLNESLKGSIYNFNDLSEMTKNNAAVLAQANMGVGEAALMFGKVNKQLGSTSRALLSMGLDFKDQGAVVAQVMADMVKQDPNVVITEKEVASRTRQYAIDLATLSAITGQNAKQLLEESKKRTGQLGVQQFLATLSPEKSAAVSKAFATMTPVMQQSVIEMMKFGGVLNKEGAIMFATMPAFADIVKDSSRAVLDGSFNDAKSAEIQQRNADDLRKQTLDTSGAMGAIGIAALTPNSPLAGLAAQAIATSDAVIKFKDAVNIRAGIEEDLARAEREAREKNVTGLTSLGGQFENFNNKAQDLLTQLTDSVIKKLPGYGTVLDSAYGELQKLIKAIPDPTIILGPMETVAAAMKTAGGFVVDNLGDIAAILATLLPSFLAWQKSGASIPATGTTPPGGSPPATGTTMPGTAEPTTKLSAAERAKEILREGGSTAGSEISAEARAAALAQARAEAKAAAELAKNSAVAMEAVGSSANALVKKLPVIGTVVAGGLAVAEAVDAESQLAKGEITKKQARRKEAEAAGAVGGGWAGAEAGGAVGAAIGASIGVWFGGVGAIPASAIGGLIGAGLGAFGGGWAGSKAAGALSDTIIDSMDKATPAPATAAPTTGAPGPQSLLTPESLRSLSDSVAAGAATGTVRGWETVNPVLSATLASSVQFATNALISRSMTAQTGADLVAQIQKATIAAAPPPVSAEQDPHLIAVTQLLTVNREQAAMIKKLVEQGQAMAEVYKDMQELHAASTGSVADAAAYLRSMSRNT